jgi:uncharacterized protein (DUF2267 family)
MVMNDSGLVAAIQRRARLGTPGEARALLEGVLRALAHVLPAEQTEAICACIPEDAEWCIRSGPSTPDPLIDREVFLGWVMSSLETTGGPDQTLGGEDPLATVAGEEAHTRVGAVLDELWERLDMSSRGAVGACLPSGVADHLTQGHVTTHQEER